MSSSFRHLWVVRRPGVSRAHLHRLLPAGDEGQVAGGGGGCVCEAVVRQRRCNGAVWRKDSAVRSHPRSQSRRARLGDGFARMTAATCRFLNR